LYQKLFHNALIAINAPKNNYRCFVSQTNKDEVGGFLQVQHYWGVNICCKVPKSMFMKITNEELKPSHAYHLIDTFRGEQK